MSSLVIVVILPLLHQHRVWTLGFTAAMAAAACACRRSPPSSGSRSHSRHIPDAPTTGKRKKKKTGVKRKWKCVKKTTTRLTYARIPPLRLTNDNFRTFVDSHFPLYIVSVCAICAVGRPLRRRTLGDL
jgi:hypothetical protein